MQPEIRIISLTQPWASCMARGFKQWETRSWSTPYRGLVAIHAAKGLPAELHGFVDEQIALGRVPRPVPRGVIVALGRLTKMVRTHMAAPHISPMEYSLGNYAPERWAWGFEDIQALSEPIPYKGAQGLRRLPPNVVEMINRCLCRV